MAPPGMMGGPPPGPPSIVDALSALVPQAASVQAQADAAQQAAPILAMLAAKLAQAPNPAAIGAMSEPSEPLEGGVPDSEDTANDPGGY
jgi:hypothetical protein